MALPNRNSQHDEEVLTVRVAPWGFWLVILTAIMCIAFSAFLVALGKLPLGFRIGILGCGLLLLWLGIAFLNPRKPQMCLTEEALLLPGFGISPIRWCDIEFAAPIGVHTLRAERIEYLGLRLCEDAAKRLRMPLIAGLFNGLTRLFALGGRKCHLLFYMDMYTPSAGVVLEEINRRVKRAKSCRPELRGS